MPGAQSEMEIEVEDFENCKKNEENDLDQNPFKLIQSVRKSLRKSVFSSTVRSPNITPKFTELSPDGTPQFFVTDLDLPLLRYEETFANSPRIQSFRINMDNESLNLLKPKNMKGTNPHTPIQSCDYSTDQSSNNNVDKEKSLFVLLSMTSGESEFAI